MSASEVARRIAVWYKQFQGYGYVCQHGESMYDEADFFTRESIACIKEKVGTQDAPAWVLLEQNYADFSDLLRKVGRTITYNDFYTKSSYIQQGAVSKQVLFTSLIL